MQASEGCNVGANAVLFGFFSQKGCPFPDSNKQARLAAIYHQIHCAVEIYHRPDVTGGEFIGEDGFVDGIDQVFAVPGEIAKTHDLSRVQKAIDMLFHAQNCRPAISGIAANRLKHRISVVQTSVYNGN